MSTCVYHHGLKHEPSALILELPLGSRLEVATAQVICAWEVTRRHYGCISKVSINTVVVSPYSLLTARAPLVDLGADMLGQASRHAFECAVGVADTKSGAVEATFARFNIKLFEHVQWGSIVLCHARSLGVSVDVPTRTPRDNVYSMTIGIVASPDKHAREQAC